MRNEFTPTPTLTPTRMQTVMFDPLAYIHPERLPLPLCCPLVRRLPRTR